MYLHDAWNIVGILYMESFFYPLFHSLSVFVSLSLYLHTVFSFISIRFGLDIVTLYMQFKKGLYFSKASWKILPSFHFPQIHYILCLIMGCRVLDESCCFRRPGTMVSINNEEKASLLTSSLSLKLKRIQLGTLKKPLIEWLYQN